MHKPTISMRMLLIAVAVLIALSVVASGVLLYSTVDTISKYRNDLYTIALDHCEQTIQKNANNLSIMMDVTALDKGVRDNIFRQNVPETEMLMLGNDMSRVVEANTYLLCPGMQIYSHKFFTYLPGDGRNFFPLEAMEREPWHAQFQQAELPVYKGFVKNASLSTYQYVLVHTVNDFNTTYKEGEARPAGIARCYEAVTVSADELMPPVRAIPGEVAKQVFLFADGVDTPVYSTATALDALAAQGLPDGEEIGRPVVHEGRTYMAGTRRVEGVPATLVVLFDADMTVGNAINAERWNLILLVSVFLLMSLLMLFFYLSYRKRLRVLTDKLDFFDEASPNAAVSPAGGDELQDMDRHIVMMQNHIRTLIGEKYETRLQLMSAQHEALIACINPHFLYNTLNTISAMANMEGAESTNEMIYALSGMFQYSSNVSKKEVTLREELKNIDDYLCIQSYRYGNDFSYHIDVPPALLACKMPKLILQPVVENCFKHGFEARGRGKRETRNEINLFAVNTDGRLVVYVTDNGRGMTEDKLRALRERLKNGAAKPTSTSKTEIGLRNVHSRLQMIYGPEAGIEISCEAGSYTGVKVTLGEIVREIEGGLANV